MSRTKPSITSTKRSTERLAVLGSMAGPVDGQRRLTYTLRDSVKFETISFDFNGHRGFLGPLKILFQSLKAVLFGLGRRIDLIYIATSRSTFGMFRDLLLMLPLKLSGAPVVAHIHGEQFEAFFLHNKRFSWAKKLYLRQLDCAIFTHDVFVPDAKSLACKVRAVRNPILDVILDYASRVPTRPEDKPASLGFISSFIPGKGLENVLELADKSQDLGLIVVAGGANNQFYKYGNIMLERVKLSKGVKYLGYLDDPTIFYDQVDYVIFPTTCAGETVSGVVVEALATGSIPILTRHNRLPEIYADAPIFWMDTPEDLSEAVNMALKTSPLELQKMKKEGKAWVRRNFPSQKEWVAQIEDILMEARH